jgi:hypothetical protein
MLPRLVCLVVLLAPLLAFAGPPATTASGDEVIEIEVERPDSGWFPSLDDPRVQAYFRSDSMVGDSLLSPRYVPNQTPLVRVGSTIGVRGAASGAERREARRWARRMVSERLSSLESCYADARGRLAIEASKISLRVTLSERSRGRIDIHAGQLGDHDGNACLQGVLAFAERGAPTFAGSVELDIPVWFWLQTQRI